MAQQNAKKIGERPESKPVNKTEVLFDTWTIMKPFVHFSIMALQVVAHALIFIVKNIPKPENHESNAKKNDKIIKI
jgi:hypothetical protein